MAQPWVKAILRKLLGQGEVGMDMAWTGAGAPLSPAQPDQLAGRASLLASCPGIHPLHPSVESTAPPTHGALSINEAPAV